MCFGSFLSYAVYKRWHSCSFLPGMKNKASVLILWSAGGAIPEVVCDLGHHFPANFVTRNINMVCFNM